MKSDSKGYYTLSLKGKRFKLHQIVMQTFEPNNIKNGYSVDHIDRHNIKDNSIFNLRWANRIMQCTNRDNSQEINKKKVKCINNNIIYNSCREAEIILNLPKSSVSRVARGERKHSRSYIFIYI